MDFVYLAPQTKKPPKGGFLMAQFSRLMALRCNQYRGSSSKYRLR